MSNANHYPSRKGKPKLEHWMFNKAMSKLNLILANWKTTLLGVSAIIVAISDGITMADIDVILVAVGAIFAKDSDKTNAAHPTTAHRAG